MSNIFDISMEEDSSCEEEETYVEAFKDKKVLSHVVVVKSDRNMVTDHDINESLKRKNDEILGIKTEQPLVLDMAHKKLDE
uniref:Uncharacterized protein n=1 Tax=Panagrolaimus sp. ES5 TaxID=591445 RepID=A0AC34GMS5_9BILA